MGRLESPVDPAEGPVQRLAYELRKLRQEAGGLTYRAMARRAGYSVTTLSQAAGGERLASLPVVLAYVQACGGDLAEWEERWHLADRELADDLDEGAEAAAPYLGLSSYDSGDADRFFGRERLVADLLDLLKRQRFAAVFGPSGSGKSSLLRAGLTTALRRESGDEIRVLTPGEHPMGNADRFRPGGSDTDVVILVDQFEEVFTLCRDQAERTEFIDLMLTPRSRTRVVLAVRADFFGRCAEHRELAEALRDANLLVGPMDREELREAIVRPALAEGVIVERTLASAIIADVADEPGALPLMSHALRETWRRRRGKMLTLAVYESIGRVHGAISHTAEILYGRLTPAQARTARRILLRLIMPGRRAEDTRRPASRAELDPLRDADTARVIELLAGARLLTLHHDTVELAHEALIASWPRLRRWVDEDRDRLNAQRQLTQAAETWERHDHDPGALYRGARLEVVGRLLDLPEHRDDLTPLERRFLHRSTALARREARIKLFFAVVLVILLVVSTTAAVVAFSQTDLAESRLDEATARLASTRAATLRAVDPAAARRLSVAAWRIAPVPEARDQLIDSMIDPATDVFTDPHNAVGSVQTLNADGTRLVVYTPGSGGEPGALRIHDLGGGGSIARLSWTNEDGVSALAVSPDGATVAVAGPTGTRLWRVGGQEPTGPAFGPEVLPGEYERVEFGLNPDLLTIAAGGVVETWDVRRGIPLLAEPVAAISPDGRLALVIPSVAHDSLVADADVAAGSLTRRGPARTRRVELWDLRKGRSIRASWLPKTATVGTFSPDGKRLALSTKTGIRVFDASTGDELTPPMLPPAERVTFSPDGRFVAGAVSTGLVHLWRADDATLLTSLPFASTRSTPVPRISGDGRLLRVNGAFGAVNTFDVSAHLRPTVLGPGDGERRFSPDGRLLAVGDDREKAWRVRVFDVATRRQLGPPLAAGEPPGEPGLPAQGPYHPVFGPDGRTLALTHPGSPTVSLWDIATGTRIGDIRVRARNAAGVRALAFSPDGATAALGVYAPQAVDPEVELWHVPSRTWTGTVTGVSGDVLTFSPDGRRLYAGDGFQGVSVDTVTRRVLPNGPDVRAGGTVLFAGDRAVTGDSAGRLSFWSPDLRESLGPSLNAHAESISALVASPDGGLLASVANGEEIVRIWDPYGRRPVGSPIKLPTESRPAVAFHGKTLLISSPDGTLHEIPVDPETVAARICARDGDLSAAEWRRHIPELPPRSCRRSPGE
ncbi:helix-turn-helix domain-containing protein [Rhizohabitans arisaemae]|uniref:nSTAND1 domain-containing NTPase n=1 Tax=Rhizohabitans arisaemae TaxID=2720610 RepID=UPI0024B2227A|nr:helix-turn-helix domain-containing protein [Rhizohabitans arisaemae]